MASKLDKKQSIMLGVIGAMALAAGFYMLYYDPSQKKIAAIHKEIEAKNREIKNAEIQVNLFKPLKERVARLEKQRDTFKAKLVKSGEIISLIKTIEDEAQRLDMKIIDMFTKVQEPPPPPKEENESGEESPEPQPPAYTKIILDISLQGKYNKLEDFLSTLQNLETFLVIEELDIISDEKIYPNLMPHMEINLYSKKETDNNAIIK